MRKTIIVIILIFIITAFAQTEIPASRGKHVNDYADILTESEEQSLEKKILNYKDSTSTEIVIVTIPGIEGLTIEEFALELGRKWGVGKKDKDNGLVILHDTKNRKIRFETGYGLEGALPDAICKRIQIKSMVPAFKEGRFYDGYNAALDDIFLALAGEFDSEGESEEAELLKLLGFIFVFIIMAIACTIHRALGAIVGAITVPLYFTLVITPLGIVGIIIAGIIGAIVGIGARELGDVALSVALSADSGGGSSGGFGGGSFGGGGATSSY